MKKDSTPPPALEVERDELRAQLKVAEETIAALAQQRSSLEALVKKMEQSISWRLTSPLRNAKAWLKDSLTSIRKGSLLHRTIRFLGPLLVGRRRFQAAAGAYHSRIVAQDLDQPRPQNTTAVLEERTKYLYLDVSRLIKDDLGTGIQRVTREIASRLIATPPWGYNLLLVESHETGYRIVSNHRGATIHPGYRGFDTEAEVYAIPGDVFLGLDLVPEISNAREWFLRQKQNGLSVSIVVYDLISLTHPQFFPPSNLVWATEWVTSVTRIADQLVSISQSTKKVLDSWVAGHALPNHHKSTWFPLGADFPVRAQDQKSSRGFDQKLSALNGKTVFLMVGTIEPRKGHFDILRAFEVLWSRGSPFCLVIAGKMGWSGQGPAGKSLSPESLLHHPQTDSQLFWFDRPSDSELDRIYAASAVLVAASYVEGYGLPIIEAKTRGMPVLARDIPVFREVGGESTRYFPDTSDPDSLAAHLEKWAADKSPGRGSVGDTYQAPTWDECVRALVPLIVPKPKLLYVGHSYHLKTKSTTFLVDVLRQSFEVTTVADESWIGGPYPDVVELGRDASAIVFFQSVPPQDLLKNLGCDNLVFVPMYDGYGGFDKAWWQAFREFKILNFSSTLHNAVTEFGLDSQLVRYFPPTRPFLPGSAGTAFFWQRTQRITFETVKKLLGKKPVRVHLHDAPDPGQVFQRPSAEDDKTYGIEYSKWFESREELDELIAAKQLYFAPREREGIGMAFLEAMAQGKVVVAPNLPTMSEYITDRKTGFLYDVDHPGELPRHNLDSIQRAAYASAEQGRKAWIESEHKIADFVLRYRPRVTVITVCFNEEHQIRETCESVVQQTYNHCEWIVIDGASTDRTLEVLEDYRTSISRLVSEPDSGIYDAMNKAIGLASGEYVIFMNAGDRFLDSDVISDVFRNRTQYADILYGDCMVRTAEGEVLHWPMPPVITMDYLLSFEGISHQSTFIKKSLFERFGVYDLSYRSVSDSERWCSFLLNKAAYLKVDRKIALYKGFDGMSSKPETRRIVDEERSRIRLNYGASREPS